MKRYRKPERRWRGRSYKKEGLLIRILRDRVFPWRKERW